MRVDPDLAALRSDSAPLLRGAGLTGTAAQEWRDAHADALADLARFGAGAGLGECSGLAALFHGPCAAALTAASEGLAGMIGAMRAAPLAPVPWRHFTNGVLHSLVLALAGRGSLSLALLDGAARATAHDPRGERLVSFQPGEMHVRVLAGGGTARILRNRSDDPRTARIEAEPFTLVRGKSYSLDGAHEALAIDRIDSALVTLRLHRKPLATGPGTGVARQYDLASGALVHQAAGLQDDSRAELGMALLRAMGRRDAAPVFALLARSGEPAARWQALRECLALDSAVGLGELCEVSETPGDPLARPARALLDQLCANDPAFAKARGMLLCPA